MKEPLSMIKEKAKALLHGQMEDNILEIGKMVNNMEKALILAKRVKENLGNGKMEERLDGLNDLYRNGEYTLK